ncbi:MAG: xanthine dehydrogenase family protein molybdopterin-binding subunit [Acidobacteria bacterium]|nr:xanthine dehydrogenase family protein molybdopterin-binding subunit [Acidobacteriota bacterium]
MAVGQNVLRKEGHEKLNGSARYIDDIALDGMLYGKTVRSAIPRGRIKSIIFDPAYDWSSVVIADYRDIPGDNYVALIENDQPLLAETEIRHCDEPILLLAAESKHEAEIAARHIRIEYEESPPLLTMEQALNCDAIIHGADNIFKSFLIARGDIDEGFKQADHIITGEYRVPHQEQLYIETQGMIAIPAKDSMTVMGSMQCPYYVHKAIKQLFNLDDEQAIVIQTTTGGGFGGKEEYPSMIAGHAALLAHKAQRPVKMIYDRSEDIAATPKRHPGIIRHRTGVTSDGRLVASEIEILFDGGAYATLSSVVLSRGAIHAQGPYRCDNVRINARAVATNTPPNGAFRGFGAPQVTFAYELQMEKIAAELGIDPLELRRINMLREGDITATGQRLTWSVGSEAVLNAAVERSDFIEKRRTISQNDTGSKRRGIGLSFFFHGAGFTGSGEAKMKAQAGVEITPEGRARILSGSTEIGQGTRTIFCQIVADELGICYDDVEIEEPDTSRVPDSGPTVASRTCMVVGRVVQLAAREAKEKLLRFVAERFGESDVRLIEGWFTADGKRLASFDETAREYINLHGELRAYARYASPPGIKWDDDTYTGDAYPVFSYGADVAEVEVDLDTYEVTTLKITTAQDIGRAIHPMLAAGQIEGGTLQAVGYGLFEELVWERGRVVNNRLTNYIIPTSLDAPEMETIIVEKEYPHGPFGAKGVGELPMDGAAPAIAAAIFNATGALVTEIPITPERLLAALENMSATKSKEAGLERQEPRIFTDTTDFHG